VGFQFCRTELLGRFPIPFHSDFDEVNLRFYVQRKRQRGTERSCIHCRGCAQSCDCDHRSGALRRELCVSSDATQDCNEWSENTVEYQLRLDRQWCRIFAQTADLPKPAPEGSLEQFITEHYWGYSTQRSSASLEYHVSHDPWKVWAARGAGFEGEVSTLYGKDLGAVPQRHPDSTFVADGSPVVVFKGDRLQTL